MILDILDDKYEVKHEIASGAMGAVYLAFHKTLRREVAIKVPHPHFSSDPAFVERFLREARAMARLDHQNIIRVFDVLLIDSHPYIIMEYFKGENLKKQLFYQGCYSSPQTINIASQISSGLSYAHSLGIIHRDIKPANIMVDKNGIAKLADFGIAAAVGEAGLTSTGEVIGTPQYMSPEQARGLDLDVRTDIYSLGIVLYQLLTGKTPLSEISTVAAIGKLAYEEKEYELSFPPDTPDALQFLLHSMMIKNREYRPQSAQEICEKFNDMMPVMIQRNVSTSLYEENDKTIVQRNTLVSSRPADVTFVATAKRESSVQPVSVKHNALPKRMAMVFGVLLMIIGSGIGYYFFQSIDSEKTQAIAITPVEAPVVSTNLNQVITPQNPLIDKPEQIQTAANVPAESVKVNDVSAASPPSLNPAAEAEKLAVQKQANQQALEVKLNDSLGELTRVKNQALRKQNKANNTQVNKWALKLLADANSSLLLAQTLETETLSLRANGLFEQAIQSCGDTITEYTNVGNKFQQAEKNANAAARLAGELENNRKNIEELHQQITDIKNAAEQLHADKVATVEFNNAGISFASSLQELQQGKEAFNNLQLDSSGIAYQRATNQANAALRDYQQAQQLAFAAQEKELQQPVTQQDISHVSQMLQQFEKSIESQNISALTKMSIDSQQKLDFINQLFSIYQTIEVSINNFAINSRQASADMTIDKLIKRNGDLTIPAASWKDTHLIVERTNAGWNKVRMP